VAVSIEATRPSAIAVVEIFRIVPPEFRVGKLDGVGPAINEPEL
jgi:hypothetical protein